MLHGVRRDWQQRLAGDGYRMRVYVPYGTQWYPYFMRRLAERPANVLFIARVSLAGDCETDRVGGTMELVRPVELIATKCDPVPSATPAWERSAWLSTRIGADRRATMASIRRIRRVSRSKPTIEGAGVRLKRAFGFHEVPQLDPFLLLDDFHSDNPADYITGFSVAPASGHRNHHLHAARRGRARRQHGQ